MFVAACSDRQTMWKPSWHLRPCAKHWWWLPELAPRCWPRKCFKSCVTVHGSDTLGMLHMSQLSLVCTVLWSRKNCRGEKDVLSVMQSAFCFHGHTKEMMQIEGIVSFKVSLSVTQALIFLLHENLNGELLLFLLVLRTFIVWPMRWQSGYCNWSANHNITSAPSPSPLPTQTCTPHPSLCSVFITMCLFLSVSLSCMCLPVSHSPFLLSLFLFLSLSVAVYLAVCLSLSLSLFLNHSQFIHSARGVYLSVCCINGQGPQYLASPNISK